RRVPAVRRQSLDHPFHPDGGWRAHRARLPLMAGNPFSLAGKTILVTGASSGLGRQTAVSCARMGATVVLSARDEQRLSQTMDMLRQAHPGVAGEAPHKSVRADLNVAEDMHALVEQ